MTSRRLRSLTPSGAAGAFLSMLEALTTRLMSVDTSDPFRDNGLVEVVGNVLGARSGIRGMVLVVGEWEFAFRPCF